MNKNKKLVGRLYTAPVNKMEIINGQIILVTTEGDGYEKREEGKENAYGRWFLINDDKNIIREAEIGKLATKVRVLDEFFSRQEFAQHEEPKQTAVPKSGEELFESFIQALNRQYLEYGLIPVAFYQNIMQKSAGEIKKKLKANDKNIAETVNEIIDFGNSQTEDFNGKDKEYKIQHLKNALSKKAFKLIRG